MAIIYCSVPMSWDPPEEASSKLELETCMRHIERNLNGCNETDFRSLIRKRVELTYLDI
jgi:hypothetical protein